MLQPKTHFEQVPLEAVMKIVAEQLWQEEIVGTALRDSFPTTARDARRQNLRRQTSAKKCVFERTLE